ncbi:MAG TPA: cadherin domain-containing protein [Dongiaceae bacterium]|nr:cadherin domain-containing protein [Dongiaceae bacterium]
MNGNTVQDLFWVRVSDTQIVGHLGSASGPAAIELDLVNPNLPTAGNTGGVDVKVTLLDNLLDPTGNGAQTVSVGNIGVVATDIDGDTATSPVTVKVIDDVPQARNDEDNVFSQSQGHWIADGNVVTGTGTLNPVAGKDTTGADGAKVTNVDGTPVGDNGGTIVHSYGSLQIGPDGSYIYTVNPGAVIPSGAKDVFTYTLTDADGDTSTATLTIDFPHVEIPTTGAVVVGAGGGSFLKEDVPGDLKLTATPQEAADAITEIKLSNIPSNLTIDGDPTHITLSNGTVAGATLVNGVLTVEVSGATAGIPVVATVHVASQEDSDVDGTGLSVTATAVNGPVSAESAPNSFNVVVDAVLDDYLDVSGSSQTETNSNSSQTFGLGLHAVLTNAGFAHSEAGGQDTDGSEHRSVTLVLNSALPSGANLSVDASIGTITKVDDTHYTLTPAGTHSYDDVAAAVQVTMPGGYVGTISGSIQSTSAEAAVSGPGEPDMSDNSKSDSATFSLQVVAHASAPTVGVSVDGAGYFKEDVANLLTFTATPTETTDHITQIVVTGLTGWTTDFSGFNLGGLGGAAGYDASTGTLTIWPANAPDGVTVTVSLQMTPPADSDVDAGITVSATAMDHAATATNTVASTLVVDAVLDDYLDVSGSSKTETNSNVSQTFGLGLHAVLANAGFAHSEAGGQDTDGSEHRSVTLVLDSALPTGASLSVNAAIGTITKVDDTHYTLTPAGTHSYDDVAAAVQVTVPGGYVGTISGTIESTSAEAAVSGPGEPDMSDNSKSDSATFSLEVDAHASAPTVGVSVEGAGYFKEDVSNVVDFTATPVESTDHITQIVVTGLTGWSVDLLSISVVGGAFNSGHFDASTGTLTIDVFGADGAAVTAKVSMTPPADSDIDGSISVSATAMDHTASASSVPATSSLVVDAVLDDYLDVAGATKTGTESSSAQSITLGLSANLANAGFAHSEAGGQDTDGSEHRTVTLVLNSALPADASLSVDPSIGTISTVDGIHYTLTPAGTHSYNDVAAAVQVNLPANYEGTISGTIESTSAEGAVSGPGEPDMSDNSKSDSADFSVTINPHVTAPTVGVAVEGAGYFKEDVTNAVTFTATPQETTDHITQIVVTGLTGWSVDTAAGHITVSSGTVGGATFNAATGTLTIDVSGAADGAPVTAKVTMTPPADSDADTAISVTATAADHALSATSAAAAGTLVVDAVLDEYLDVSGTSQSGTESAAGQSIGLGLHAVLSGAGFTYSGQGGSDTDGSEHRSVTLVLNAALPSGASFSVVGGAGIGTVTMVDATHYTITPGAGHSYDDVAAAIQVNLPANYQGTISGSIQSTSAETTSGLEFDTGDNAKNDSADFSLTVNPHVTAPTVGAAIEGTGFFKEDVANTVGFTATPQEPTDHITTITVTGLTGWTVNSGTITLSNGTVGSTSFAGGVLTINVSGATDGTPVTAHVTMTPPADSDVDAAITVTATAADHALSATSSATAGTLVVDAVLDQYLHVTGTTQTDAGSASPQSINLGLSSSLQTAQYTHSGAGGADTDGSEHYSAKLTLDNPLPSGATLGAGTYGTVALDSGNTYTLTPAGGYTVQDMISHLQVSVTGGWSGTISGSLNSLSAEAATSGPGEPNMSDNSQTDTAKFSVTVLPSQAPVNYDDSVSVDEPGTAKNVMIILDRSLSMTTDDPDGPGGYANRLALAVDAIQNLLNQYGDSARVMVVQFSTGQSNGIDSASSWMSPSDAMAYINTHPESNNAGTNYDAAIQLATSVLNTNTTGKIAGADTVVYFMSDGQPNSGGTGSDHELSSTTAGNWNTALEGHNVSQVYAVGMGNGIPDGANNVPMNQVADPDGNDNPANQTIIVTQEDQLSANLGATVGNTVAGNVLNGSITTEAGHVGQADQAGTGATHLAYLSYTAGAQSITITWNGTGNLASTVTGSGPISVLSTDNTNHTITFTTAEGTMTFYFDTASGHTAGDFSFVATQSVTATTQETFHYYTQDSFGQTETATPQTEPGGANLVITVNNVMHPPIITSGATGTEAENTAASNVVYKTVASDADGHTLTYSISGTDAALFHIDQNTGAVTFINSPNYENPLDSGKDNVYNITVDAYDAVNNQHATQAVAITVTDVNEAPAFTSGTTGNENENAPISTQAYQAAAVDPDAGDKLTYSLSSGGDNSKFNIDANTGVVTFKSSPNYESPGDSNSDNVYNITVHAKDTAGHDVTQNVAITVNNVNEAPTITSGASASENENTPVATQVYKVTATDPDAGTILTYALDSGGDNDLFNINSSTGVITFKNAPDYENPLDSNDDNNYQIVVHAKDGVNDVTKAVTITVNNVNEAPSAVADTIYTNLTTGIVVESAWLTFNDTDPENNSLTVSAISNASGLTDSFNGSTHEVTINSFSGGSHSFDYTVNDGTSNSATTGHVTVINNSIAGSAGSDIVIAGSGNDTIDAHGSNVAGGHDVISAGAGDDKITYHSGDVVDGGANSSSDLGSNSYLGDVLDVSQIAGTVDIHTNIANLDHIETINATGGGNQAIILQASDVISMSDTTFNPSGSSLPTVVAMKVEGNAGDTLKLDDSSGQWHNITGSISNDPSGHAVYAFDSNGGSLDGGHVTAYVIVSTNITVTDHNGNTIGA